MLRAPLAEPRDHKHQSEALHDLEHGYFCTLHVLDRWLACRADCALYHLVGS